MSEPPSAEKGGAMAMSEPITCTCPLYDEKWIHHVECFLWDDEDFANGTHRWDMDSWELVEAGVDDYRTEEDWMEILSTQGQPCDPWNVDELADDELDAIVEQYRQERKAQHPANDMPVVEPVDDVTDEEWASSDGPRGLKCFCFKTETGNYCGPCGLVRNSSSEPWRMTYQHEQWAKEPKVCEHTPQCDLFCEKANAQRWSSQATRWVFWNPALVKNKHGNYSYSYGTYTQKCRHYGVEIRFPDDTVIYASSLKNSKKPDEDLIPDLGIYMAGSWTPTSVAYHLGWTDYGLPTIPDHQVRYIIETGLAWARDDRIVEIGCIGGHGRTGTVMALMALHCGVESPEAAIEWVHKNYCEEAIEGADQVWYVKKYHALLHGLQIPERPAKKSTVTTSTTTVIGMPSTTPHAKGSLVKDQDLPVPVGNLLSTYGLSDVGWEDLMGWF